MSTYVVAGITGHVGSVVATELLAHGVKVKAVVRDTARAREWVTRGVEAAAGSVDDDAFLAGVLAGADGFFVLLPPYPPGDDFYGGQRLTAEAIGRAVQQSAVPLVVMLSSLGAELPSGNGPIKGLHHLENVLRATGTKLVSIRASYFQENIASVLPAARDAGIYPNFLPSADFAIPMIATKDIGRLAASILLSAPAASETVDLIGPSYSARQLSAKLAAVFGKPVQVVDIPAAGRLDALLQAGLPRPLAEVYDEMYAGIGSGLIAPHGDRIETGSTEIDEVIHSLTAQ